MNRNPVFNTGDWQLTTNGVWEAQAASPELGGRPPFEATCRTYPTVEGWSWTLFRPADEGPDAELAPTSRGQAQTLADAQRQADNAARRWRDHPLAMAAGDRLRRYSEHSVVICDGCTASHRLGQLLLAEGYCDANLPDGSSCSSTNFDGFSIDDLAEAVTR